MSIFVEKSKEDISNINTLVHEYITQDIKAKNKTKHPDIGLGRCQISTLYINITE